MRRKTATKTGQPHNANNASRRACREAQARRRHADRKAMAEALVGRGDDYWTDMARTMMEGLLAFVECEGKRRGK